MKRGTNWALLGAIGAFVIHFGSYSAILAQEANTKPIVMRGDTRIETEQRAQDLMAEEDALIQQEKLLSERLPKKVEAPAPASEKAAPLAPAAAPAQKQNAKPASAENKQTAELEQKLRVAQDRIRQLLSALDDNRRRLMVAETEVERLSNIVEGRQSRMARYSPTPAVTAKTQPAAKPAGYTQETAPGEMAIATVISEKANLRTGPGKDNSPLMSVGQGTRLAVETRQGDWYRVVTPTGARAWVSSDVIAFGPGSKWMPSQTVRVKAYDTSAEDAAFDLISKGGAAE